MIAHLGRRHRRFNKDKDAISTYSCSHGHEIHTRPNCGAFWPKSEDTAAFPQLSAGCVSSLLQLGSFMVLRVTEGCRMLNGTFS